MQTGLAGSLSWRMGPWKSSVMLIADNSYWTKVKGHSSDFLFTFQKLLNLGRLVLPTNLARLYVSYINSNSS